MNSLFLAYCLLVLAGVAWIAYRAVMYMRSEREREARWADMLEDEDFKKYLKQISTENKTGGDQKGTEPARVGAGSQAPPIGSRRGLPPEPKKPSAPPPVHPPDRKPRSQPDKKPQQPSTQPRPSERRPPGRGA
ncbi:MAG: hypothetical protein LDL33_11995 [Desulfomonile sp.]|nr:hypothetical protein [Desulfomonile sp.]